MTREIYHSAFLEKVFWNDREISQNCSATTLITRIFFIFLFFFLEIVLQRRAAWGQREARRKRIATAVFSRFCSGPGPLQARARLGRAAGRGEAREAALPASQRSPIPATSLGARPTPALQPRAPLRVLAAAPHGARRRFAARKDFIPYRAPGLRSTHPGPMMLASPNVPHFPLLTVPQRPETSLSVP